MQCITAFVFCAVLSAVKGNTFEDIGQDIGSTNDNLEKYNNYLDQIVSFRDFRESLRGIYTLDHYYNGKYEADVSNIAQLGFEATKKYFSATHGILQWCKEVDKIIVNRLDYVPDKGGALKSLYNILVESGADAIKESLSSLESTRENLRDMLEDLTTIPRNLAEEIVELKNDHEQGVENNHWNWTTASTMNNQVSNIVLSFVAGPVGRLMDLYRRLSYEKIPVAVMEGRVIPNEHQKWKISEVYLNSLKDVVNASLRKVTYVRETLADELHQVEGINVDGGFPDGSIGAFWLPQNKLQNIKFTLESFISRHSESDVLYGNSE